MKDYRYYLRDYHIDDEQYNEIIYDLLHEIAYETNIWKKEFWFDVIKEQEYYDFNALLQMYEHDEYSTVKATAPEGYDSDTKDYSKSISNIIDVRYLEKNISGVLTEFTRNFSAIGSDFEYENPFTLRYINQDYKILEDNDYKRYIAIVSIVPTQEQVTEMRETLVTKCLISGLKYKVGSMYTNQHDQQYIQFLKQNYEYELNKIKNLQPVNSFWQKKEPNKGFLI